MRFCLAILVHSAWTRETTEETGMGRGMVVASNNLPKQGPSHDGPKTPGIIRLPFPGVSTYPSLTDPLGLT